MPARSGRWCEVSGRQCFALLPAVLCAVRWQWELDHFGLDLGGEWRKRVETTTGDWELLIYRKGLVHFEISACVGSTESSLWTGFDRSGAVIVGHFAT